MISFCHPLSPQTLVETSQLRNEVGISNDFLGLFTPFPSPLGEPDTPALSVGVLIFVLGRILHFQDPDPVFDKDF